MTQLTTPWGKIDSDDAGCLARVPTPDLTTTTFAPLHRLLPEAANDNLPPVVAFTGQAGAGKSTAARYLVERHGYKLVKFAAPLKNMMRAIGLTEEEIEGDLKEVPSGKLCGKTPRHAMQTIGTQWGRDCIGADFWIRLWLAEAAKHERVVTDDCRFPNEAKAVRKAGGDIILIAGRGGIAGGHESERGCGQYDVLVDNAGGLGELERRIEEAIRRYG